MPFSMLIPSITAPDLIAIVVTAIDVVAVIALVIVFVVAATDVRTE